MYEQDRFEHEEYREPGAIAVDLKAPDFTLKDENGREVSLYGYKGDEQLVLVFVRGVDDQYTRQQLLYIKDSLQRIEHLKGKVLAVSYGSVSENRSLANKLGLPFHILSDPECSAIKLYEIYNRYDKLVGPAVFVIDKAGTIRYIYVGKNPKDIVNNEDVLAALQGFPRSQSEWPPETYGTDFGQESRKGLH